jgi:ribosomal protein S18 acetylase RimI-like enzyme
MTASRDGKIRRAMPRDAEPLAVLRFEFRSAVDAAHEARSDFIDRCARWMRRHLSPGGSWRAWMAEQEGQVSGAIWLQLLEKLPNPVAEPERHGYISNLYVRPQFRGCGLGSRLLAAALAECEASSVDAIVLWPTAKSRSLYERHGFSVPTDLMARRPLRSSYTGTSNVDG